MQDNSFDSSNISLDEIFHQNEKYTFIVGAGISMAPPTFLPSANKLIHNFFDHMIPSEEREHINKLHSLRFEKIIELVQDHIDKELSFLGDFDDREPNLLHHFLATAIMNGHYVITTNFDCMIEKTLSEKVDDISTILPVITKEDFSNHSDPDLEVRSGKYPIYKIHGSKINFITKESTKESLVTTISALGREGEEKTFSIAPYKKLAFNNLICGRTLIVMGYSGGDEFDISPSLLELQELSSIIWITHTDKIACHNAKIRVFREKHFFNKNTSFSTTSEKLFFELLYEANKWGRHLLIYDLQVDTSLLIEEYLFSRLFPSDSSLTTLKNKLNIDESEAEPYIINLNPISDIIKYDVACWIYFDLNETRSTYRCAKNGLNLSKRNNDARNQIVFLKWIGILSRFDKKYRSASKHFKTAIRICSKIQDEHEKSIVLNEIGRNYEHQKKYYKALRYYERALAKVADNSKNRAIFLNNIANIHLEIHNSDIALSEFEEVFRITQKLNDLAGLAFSRLNIATTKFNIAKSPTEKEIAIQECQEAIKYTGKIGDLYLKAMFLTRQSSMYDQLGMHEFSRSTLEEVFKIYQLINHPEGIATTLLNIGASLVSQNYYADAIQKYQDALEIFKKLENEIKQAELHHYIAGSYFSMQKVEKAFVHEKCAFEIAEKLKLPEKRMYNHYLDIIQSNRMNAFR